MSGRRWRLAPAVAVGWWLPILAAQGETLLGTVTVEAEAIAETSDETATIATLTSEQLRRDMAATIKDAVRYEAGVSVTNNPSRFGQAGFNIRGVDGDRVAMQIDGIGLPDEFKTGGYSNAGRNLVDVRLLKKIDIQRGSGSVMYGSGALGGVVNYVTPDPEDYLVDGRSIGGRIEAQYFSANEARALIPALAVGGERFKFLASGVFQRGAETETMGTNDTISVQRTVANPQDDQLNTGLVKLAYVPDAVRRTSLTLETYSRTVETDIHSQVRGQTTALFGVDDYRRDRVSLEQTLDDLAFGKLKLHLYAQHSNTRQDTYDTRRKGAQATWEDAMRIFDIDQDSLGLRVMGESILEAAGGHRLVWGLDVQRRETLQMRDGYTRRASDGLYKCYDSSTSPTRCAPDQVNGLAYPDRDFPPSTVDTMGLYAQDNWLVSDQWSITLGGRYDRQQLKIAPDLIYLDPNLDGAYKTAPSPQTAQAFSPKLGATRRFDGGYALSAAYNFGFRAPPYDSVNYGFDNTQEGYTTVPNPDLKAERSRGPEIKLERRGEGGHWSLSVYRTDYDDFMEMITLCDPFNPLPSDPPICAANPGVSVYQFINLPQAWIHGFEGQAVLRLSPRWRLRATLTYAKGRDFEANPLNSIDPLNGVLGVAYVRPSWEMDASLTLVKGKSEADARKTETGSVYRQFLTKGYGVLDLRAHWRFTKSGRLSIGLLNVFDRKYVQWADVPVRDQAHIADSGTGPDRYTQPGRNVTVSLSYSF